MYYIHNLRSNLQEWKNRLYRANHDQFGIQLNFFLNKLSSTQLLVSILSEYEAKYSPIDDELKAILEDEDNFGGKEMNFENDYHQAFFCYKIFNYLRDNNNINYILHNSFFARRDNEETRSNIIECYIAPIVNYLHDRLDESNSIIYLLEKYKRRTEWFLRNQLLEKYKNASNKAYEQVFEDDLRMYLFDQGIEYPFSTPKSSSGRADIIDTTDPLVLEIKVIDFEKGYKKNRIIDGFKQIVKYTNDYNKSIGYLAIFNASDCEINFNFADNDGKFPPRFFVGNKTYFFIIINLNFSTSASKLGKVEIIEVTAADLLQD
jgi:hypothetical protein